jgi:hypothetical protein
MHDLIASYLFQNKTCPLPGLGNLTLTTSGARTDFSNNLIIAPVSSIQFAPGETDAGPLLTWLANKTNTDKHAAATSLDSFCSQLKDNAAAPESGTRLEAVGNFVVDDNGDISFVPVELPQHFAQAVPAERVIRLDAQHDMLVGDKQTTNIAMAEYLNEESPKKDRWWIWAIALGAIGLSLICIYAADRDASAEFGNAIKILSFP